MKYTHNILPLTSAIALALSPVSLMAEELEEVVITATRMQSVDSTTHLSKIDSNSLSEQLIVSSDTSSILANKLPAFAPSRQKLTSRGETLRGREPLYMVDGVPQSNPLRDGDRTSQTIAPLALESIEVIHSANSIHGVGASGGTINLVTRTPEEGIKHSIQLGMRGQQETESLGGNASYSIEASNGTSDVIVVANRTQEGYYYDADGDIIGSDTVQGDSQNSDANGLFVKVGHNLSDHHRLSLSYNYYQQENNGELMPIKAGAPGNDTDKTISEERRQSWTPATTEIEMFNLAYQGDLTDNTTVQANAYYQTFSAIFGGGCWADFYDPAFDPGTNPSAGTVACGSGSANETYFWDQSRNKSDKQGIKLSFVTEFDSLDLGYGFDYGTDSTEQDMVQTPRAWVPESEYQSIGAYLQASWAITDSVTLSSGIRQEEGELNVADYHTLYGYGDTDINGGTVDYSETLYNAGASWDLSDALTLRASYSQGYSMPDVGRALRSPATGATSVDDFLTLEPVITDNYEAGFDYQIDRLDLHVTVYQSTSDFGNTMTWVEDANFGGHYELKRQPVEYNGLEVNLNYDLSEKDIIGLGYALSRGYEDVEDAQSGATKQRDLTGINAGLDRMLISWDREWNTTWNSRIQASYAFDRDYHDENDEVFARFDGYLLIDAMLTQQLSMGTLSYGISNLLNEDYRSYYSQTEKPTTTSQQFAGIGRTWSVGYQVSF